MTFLQCFLHTLPFTFAFFHVKLRYISVWEQEDRVLRRRGAGLGVVDGRLVIRQADGEPVMFFDDFYTLPYRAESEFGAGRE